MKLPLQRHNCGAGDSWRQRFLVTHAHGGVSTELTISLDD